MNSGHTRHRPLMMKDDMRRKTRDLGCYQRGRQAPGEHNLCTPIGGSPGGHRRDKSLVKNKNPSKWLSSEPPPSHRPLLPAIRTPLASPPPPVKMSFSGIPESTASQLTTAHDDNSYCEGNLGLGGFSYLDPSNIAGPSQPYFGVDVWGDFSNYPDFASPSSAPMSLFPVNGGYPSEGKSYFVPQ